MNRTTVVSLVALCLTVAGCGKINWKEFSSSEGKFSVQLPGEPKKETKSLPVPGVNINMYFFVVERKEGAYGVAYADFPPGTPFDYKGGVDGIARSNGGTVTTQNDWTISGVKGVEAEMTITRPQKGFCSVRMVYINNRLYQLLCMGTDAKLSNSTVKKLFDSFSITK